MLFILVAIVLMAWSQTVDRVSQAQTPPTFSQDLRLWSPVYLTVTLPASFLAYIDMNPRFSDSISELHQTFLRPALGYRLTENLSIWQGYAWISNYQPSLVQEHHVFQQLLYMRRVLNFHILSRTRLEERFIEHVDGIAMRFRTMLRGMYPLPPVPGLALVAWDEIFVNLNTVGQQGPAAGLDQNRLFIGVNRMFSPRFNMDIGYLNQLLDSSQIPGLANQMNHIILLQFFVDL